MYSDSAFKTAAIEWLIETNQVCQLAIAQAVKGIHPQNVQAATVVIASSPQVRFTFLVF